MSLVDIYKREMFQDEQESYYKRYKDNHQRMTTLYTKWNYSDNTSTIFSSSTSSSIEVLFTRLLDALIFTSAIAITAYSYLTGTLLEPNYVESNRTHQNKQSILISTMEDHKKKRTQEWAEQQLFSSNLINKRRSYSIVSKTQPISREDLKRERKKRTKSLPVNKLEKEDELLLRMESLIQQGQQALSSPVSSRKET